MVEVETRAGVEPGGGRREIEESLSPRALGLRHIPT